MPPATERQTIAIFPGVRVFEHVVILDDLQRRRGEGEPFRRPLMSSCTTRFPQSRCSCFMYALVWCDDSKEPH